jgi:hypothetical protein
MHWLPASVGLQAGAWVALVETPYLSKGLRSFFLWIKTIHMCVKNYTFLAISKVRFLFFFFAISFVDCH